MQDISHGLDRIFYSFLLVEVCSANSSHNGSKNYGNSNKNKAINIR